MSQGSAQPSPTRVVSGTCDHILVFAFPAQGHMLALLDLPHKLAIRGLFITIVVTPKNVPILTHLLSSHPITVKTLILPFPGHPSIPPGVENMSELPYLGIGDMTVALNELDNPTDDWFQNHSSPPVAIISDLFLGFYFDHIKTEYGHDRVFAVGPLLPSGNNTIERGGSSWKDVLSWLDTCAAKSVLFVSFGSQFVLTNKQMEELALGLETSGVKFVWAVKEPTGGHVTGEYGKIPAGFEDRVAGRGLVARGWVPQVAILNHGSVVALLTYCGWNSIMEAMMAGVLMLTWPMSADNFSNVRLLHELKIGVKACEGRRACSRLE
nr:UDP-glycosyltransferase 89B2-like [Tanacetum cinerariifolium]